MALNKNALIRYKTIDKCLQNTYRYWTLDDLIEACSDALYEYEGKDVNVSKRTIQLDIQTMRSDKLGYNAPIESYNKKYYRYSDEGYSITNIPLTENDMHVLSETVEMLKQFKDFSLFSELGGIIQKLEDKVYSEKLHQQSIIHLDKNENLKGLEHLDTLYQAVLKKIIVNINYKSFKARQAQSVSFKPLILKEFNNRWFIVGRKLSHPDYINTFALDRIIDITPDLSKNYTPDTFIGDNYYANTIGVTVLNIEQLEPTVLRFNRIHAPYVLTKPFHASQELIEKHVDGGISIKLMVDHNYEFERKVLGFGNGVRVISPIRFKRRIKAIFKSGLEMYEKFS